MVCAYSLLEDLIIILFVIILGQSSHGDLVILQALGLTFSVYVLMSSVHPLFTSFDLCICVVFPFVKGFSFWENSVFAGNGLRGTSVPLAPSML